MNELQKKNDSKGISPIESAMMMNDLSKLTTEQRAVYYKDVCESVGINPLTQPFQYIILNGKLKLYATRDATEQLRKINGVSISITARDRFDDIYVVSCKATDKNGRTDESTGAVSIAGLRGDALANAYMKAETKSKRRVTLSICGLGLLDETEIDSIPDAKIFKENKQSQVEIEAINKREERKKDLEKMKEEKVIEGEVVKENKGDSFSTFEKTPENLVKAITNICSVVCKNMNKTEKLKFIKDELKVKDFRELSKMDIFFLDDIFQALCSKYENELKQE